MTTKDNAMLKQLVIGLLLMCIAGIAAHASYNNASVDRVVAIERRQDSQERMLQRIDDKVGDLHTFLITSSKQK